MATTHVVVDGSNVATEGRKKPSLAQLREAVDEFVAERHADRVTVIVDASFPNRIDKNEAREYEQLVDAGEIITPPAGVIGRGDAFILQVADKAGATIFSNDSFQEFHGEYRWLFDEGRLIGGKPVPGVGWVFVDRAPVRGPTSRKARRDADRKDQATDTAEPAETLRPARKRAAAKKAVAKAVARTAAKKTTAKKAAAERSAAEKAAAERTATGKASAGKASAGKASAGKTTAPKASGRRRTRRAKVDEVPAAADGAPPEPPAGAAPVVDLLPFLEFVGAHPLGTVVTGTVERFASHGAYVSVSGIRGYVPLKKLGEPPPTRARTVLERGEEREFVIDGVDTPRRGLDLALPGFGTAPVPGTSTDEDLAGPRGAEPPTEGSQMAPAKKKAATKKRAASKKAASKRTAAKKSAAKRTSTRKKATTKRAPARKKAPAKKKSAAKKASARKSAAKQSAARKSSAKKKAGTKKASARKRAAKKAAGNRR